VRMTDDLPPS